VVGRRRRRLVVKARRPSPVGSDTAAMATAGVDWSLESELLHGSPADHDRRLDGTACLLGLGVHAGQGGLINRA
jgi:hypothetical protein